MVMPPYSIKARTAVVSRKFLSWSATLEVGPIMALATVRTMVSRR